MKGFVVFEVAPPFRWKPKYERQPGGGGKFHRFIWAWFSFTIVFNMKWTEFIKTLMLSTSAIEEPNTTTKPGHDEHEDNLGIG